MLKQFFAVVFFLFLNAGLVYSAPVFIRPTVFCPRLDAPPQIDGKIDDPCWQKAARLNNYLKCSGEILAREQTEAYLGYDDTCLYLAFKCYDSQMDKLGAGITNRDANVWTDSCVEIFLDPELTRCYYMQLIVNPLGTQQDIKITEIADNAWNITWESKGFKGDNYWSVELAIPFSQLGMKTPKVGERWGINFNRELHRLGEFSCWAPTYQDFFDVASMFGDLVFSAGPGVSFKLVSFGENQTAEVEVQSVLASNLFVDLDTVSADGKRATSTQEVKPEELGKIVKIPCKFPPSFQELFLNARIRSADGKTILYQSPDFPLPGKFLEPKLAQVRSDLERLVADNLVVKAQLKTGQNPYGYLLVPKKPFEIIMPRDLPNDDEIGQAMHIAACPGEYEPATFIIYTTKDLKNVSVGLAADLKNGRDKITKDQVDIRILKRWFQEIWFNRPVGQTELVPELLLKNDAILFADYEKKRNVLNFKGRPEDSPSLLPFNLNAFNNNQIWLTVNVPATAKPGLYKSTVEVKAEGTPAHSIPLEVEVRPIKLIKPKVNYSIYYHNCIGGGSPIGAQPDSYEAEIKDLAAHGFTSVFVQEGVKLIVENGQRRVDMVDLKRALDMRVKYGLTAPTIYCGFNWATKEPDALFRKPLDKITPEEKETITFIANAIVKMLKDNPMYPELIFLLNVDEPGYDSTGGQLKLAALNCELLQKAGARTTTAITTDGADKLGALLNCAILDEPSARRMYQKSDYRKSARLEYFYWHPISNPTHDRLRFGLVMWKTKLDGTAPWVYQWAGASGWLEAAEGAEGKAHLDYTYPATNGVIPTIQWEAVREGIDDVRYLTTLESWVKKAEGYGDQPGIKAAIAEAQELLALPEVFHDDVLTLNSKLTPDDFENLRQRIAASIIKLQKIAE